MTAADPATSHTAAAQCHSQDTLAVASTPADAQLYPFHPNALAAVTTHADVHTQDHVLLAVPYLAAAHQHQEDGLAAATTHVFALSCRPNVPVADTTRADAPTQNVAPNAE